MLASTASWTDSIVVCKQQTNAAEETIKHLPSISSKLFQALTFTSRRLIQLVGTIKLNLKRIKKLNTALLYNLACLRLASWNDLELTLGKTKDVLVREMQSPEKSA